MINQNITVRVYGIFQNEMQMCLVSDEIIKGKFYTKFVGGGLEFGEGTRECLVREFKEELNIDVEVLEHIYTTDFYVQSAFNIAQQILSIYYRVKLLEPLLLPVQTMAFDIDSFENGSTEKYRYVPMQNFSEESVCLPIDKLVAKMISN